MSAKRVIPSEMKRLTDIEQVGTERLLSGHAISDDAEPGDVARFFDDVRDAYPEAAADGCEDSHLARMFEAAHLLAEMGDPAARPVSNANGPVTQASGLPKLGRIEMIKTLIGSTKFKVVAASLALLVASSGTAFAASQGVLPAPIQDAVSGAAAAVGIDVPTADEALEVDDDGVETDSVDSLEESGTIAGGQGDELDDEADDDADEADDDATDDDADEADDDADDDANDEADDDADNQADDDADDDAAVQIDDQDDDQDDDQADNQADELDDELDDDEAANDDTESDESDD